MGRAGERAESELVGDFDRSEAEAVIRWGAEHSFGLHNERDGSVRCVRDRCGVQPLYYVSRPGEFFAFAAGIEPLLGLPEVGRRLNRLKAAIYLGHADWDAFDARLTFFEGVYRLPPGHEVVAKRDGVTVRRYVSFDGFEEFRQVTAEELSEELLARLRRAVQRRSDGAGVLLSGGLKSAVVAALACETRGAPQRLPCWAFVPTDVPGWRWPGDPRPAIDALAARLPLELHPVGWAESKSVIAGDCYPEVREQPRWFYIYNDEAVAMAGAEKAGLTALLTGMGGEWLPIFRRPVGLGWAALRDGDWRSLLFDEQHARVRGAREVARILKRDILVPSLPEPIRRRWAGAHPRPNDRIERRPLVRESFLAETGADDWLKERGGHLGRDFRENAYAAMTRGGMQLHLENWARLGRCHGLEFRHPFLDREVVDFCFRLPASYHLGGDSLRVLREAMRGLLPDIVRGRTQRLATVADWPLRKLERNRTQRARLAELEKHPLLSTMLDLSPVHEALDRFPSEAAMQHAVASGGHLAATRLARPGGVLTTLEYFWSFAQFLDRNGFH